MGRFKRWAALLLAGVMLLTGCTNQKEENTKSAAEAGASMETAEKEKSMGRYLEQEITLPEEIAAMGTYPVGYFGKLDNGKLVLVEQRAGKYVSEDNGETWEREEAPWLTENLMDSYISHIALSPDGAMAVIYSPYSSDDEAEESVDEDDPYQPEYLYVDAAGNTKKITFSEKGNYFHQFWFDRDGLLYGYDMNGKVYEIDTQADTVKQLFEIEGLSDYVCFTEKYMIIISSRGVNVYDMEAKMLDEDKVLSDFIMNSVGNELGANSDSHSVVMAEGGQPDVIYFALNSGLYRHVIGGAAVEQVADGSITSLGDPMMTLCGMAVLPDNEFAVLYNDVKLYRYVYDPDVPTVPDEKVSIYSLTEDYTIRQAVSLFQKQNPDVYVRYEVGISGENGMTAEDAVKNLNTRMLSGSGPDLLVLDGLPAASYTAKGILADLSGVVGNMSGENSLFPNLVEACREDGAIYSLPVRFQLPVIAGDVQSVRNVTDLETLANAVERLREENPEGSLIGLRTEEEVLYTLGLACSGAWLDENGAIDEEMLTEFLTQARRIYQAEIAGQDPRALEDYRESHQENWSTDETGAGHYYANAAASSLDIAMGDQKLSVGRVFRMDFDYNIIGTLANQEKNFAYGLWQGQVPGGFIPCTRVGIYTKSAQKEEVLEFFGFLYGRELQDLDLIGGFPVNMESFDSFAENPRGEYDMGGLAMSDSDGGDIFSLEVEWVGQEDFQRLKEMVKSLNSICSGDSTIESVVRTLGEKALSEDGNVEDTVEEIVKKAAIYLAE